MPYRELIERALDERLPVSGLRGANRLNAAMRYAVFPGGKRMRPILTLLGAEAAGGAIDDALNAACAVEFLHASSLIFDDLPAMDNASERRGAPAVHVEFGQDIALLAALGLFNQAYALFGGCGALMREAADCIGVNGMIGGQAVEDYEKTTALMRLALTAGAIACGADHAHVRALARCGECLGEAYQLYDDLLDGDVAHMPSGSLRRAEELVDEAKRAAGLRGARLAMAIDAIVEEFSSPLLAAR